jgi:acyl-CoA synthetase (AMP-forming)/AMP-acid ligase II
MTSIPTTDRSRAPVSRCPTLVALLRYRAELDPEQLGFRFLSDGEARAATLSYGELDRGARAFAAELQSLHRPGDRALLVYPPGLELVSAYLGCLYAGSVAVMVAPPTPARLARFLTRAAAICRDAAPTVVLTTPEVHRLLSDAALPPELAAPRWRMTGEGREGAASDWHDPGAGPDDLAFLQYTSGSTTEPRGVLVTHGNLMENLRAIRRTFRQPPGTESVCWLPPYHDMGLVGGILAPLYLGNAVTLLPPAAFVQRPSRWLHAISRYRATVSGGPNFAYELCVRRATLEQCEGLELGAWEVAFNGAEPVDPGTLRRFAERFARYGFRATAFKPCYGLAEATLLVAAPPGRAPPSVRTFRADELQRDRVRPAAESEAGGTALLSYGPPVERVEIADPETCARCPPGVVGEIWVSGPSVARGYWSQPGEGGTAVGALLAGTTAPTWLRTGDLGFLLEGELFVTGRLKDLIIVDGANHYPQDLERTAVAAHPALFAAEAAAFSARLPDGEGVVVAVAPHRRIEVPAAELRQAIRAAVTAAHDVRLHQVVLVRTGGLPRTASGKIRRALCRTGYLDGTLEPWEQP